MTDEELAAIRERVEKATPGPWYRRIPYHGDVGYVATKDPQYAGDRVVGTLDTAGMSKRRDILFPELVADAEFICHAREDIPALLTEIQRLNMGCAVLQTKIDVGAFQYHNDVISVEEANGQLIDDRSKLLAENAALRKIVEAVAEHYDCELSSDECWYVCAFCPAQMDEVRLRVDGEPFVHGPDCPITKARTLLGK